MIDITPGEMDLVKAILKEYVPEARVIAFGSRVNGTKRDISDLDLAIDSARKMSIYEIGRLKEAFQESTLPFRVDVIDWNRTSEEFKAIILEKFEEIAVQ